jgi:hypothetical protein
VPWLAAVVVLRAEGIAASLLSARVQALRQGGLLNPDRNERVIESFNNSRARRLEVWLVRGFGAFLIAGAVPAIAS